ncbi:Uncharacterised protein [Bordetella pertussis]|nr:Uncharacterised protein [Bordetella pertussis]
MAAYNAASARSTSTGSVSPARYCATPPLNV